MTKEQFIEECAFAKVVVGPDGRDCLLIGGYVISVSGHLVTGETLAMCLASALRSGLRESVVASGSAANPEAESLK